MEVLANGLLDLTAMLYNSNNVALEASPLTTIIEMKVGKQLCKMLGYNIREELPLPVGWGHITCVSEPK